MCSKLTVIGLHVQGDINTEFILNFLIFKTRVLQI